MTVFFNNLPTSIQAAIQTGLLDRTFKKGITARLGYRQIAERMQFPGGLGQTITDTKPGLLPVAITPLAVRSNSDLDDGLTNSSYPFEQYTIGVSPYAQTMQLQLASAAQAIDSLYLQNAYALGESANRTIDTLAYNALFNGYMGYNTRVTATLGSPGTAVAVDDVRGFFESVQTSTSKVVATSASNQLSVKVGSTLYTLNTAVADGAAPATVDYTFNNLAFSGSGSNTSTTPGGFSGVLTFSANVSIADATAGNSVVAAIAPTIVRPYASNVQRANSSKIVAGDLMTLRMIQKAVSQMRANGINDNLWCFLTDEQLQGLWQDTEWRQYFQGRSETTEFRDFKVSHVMGVNYVTNNIAAVDTNTVSGVPIHRAIVVAPGALLEADFTSRAYGEAVQSDMSEVSVIDNIAHITRPPLNRMADVVTQTWSSYLGFCTPTDTTANPTVIPTANNACKKRAIIIESAVN